MACGLRRLFTFSSSSPEEHLANFNQTWHKVFLGEGDTSFVKWSMPISKETSKWDSENSHFQPKFLKCFFGEGSSSFYE